MKPIKLSIILGLAMTFVACYLTVAAKEVTLAEVPSEVGCNTVHVGKWHMGTSWRPAPTIKGSISPPSFSTTANLEQNQPNTK